MIRFIWQNWWRHKERFILLLVGALIVSSGLSYLVGMSQTNRGTVVNDLEKRWTASYDIVVRPVGSRSITENKHLLEPDYLSGLFGGISLNQWHTIQKIQGVSVAAPIAMIGYIPYTATFKTIHIKPKGVYRYTEKMITDTGPRNLVDQFHNYFINGISLMQSRKLATYEFQGQLYGDSSVLLAGIDPKAEAQLVGLNHAVVKKGNSRYFKNGDTVSVSHPNPGGKYRIPVLVSNLNYVNETFRYTIQRLKVPLNQKTLDTMTHGTNPINFQYLDSIPTVSRSKRTYTFRSKQLFRYFIEDVTGINPKTGKKVNQTHGTGINVQVLSEKPSPLKLRPVASPFAKKWPYAYEIRTSKGLSSGYQDKNNPNLSDQPTEHFRAVKLFSHNKHNSLDAPAIEPYFIGVFNPKKLRISKDPLTELPMETYRPGSAKLVLNAHGKPVNPPIDMRPDNDSTGLLTKPPAMLTTIQAAAKILGKKPISSIRIKVAGVHNLSKTSQQKLQKVAHEIHKQTGLITDITLGSSPQPALTYVPAINHLSALGWIQQPWVKLGASFAIFKQTEIGFSGVIGSVILVAVVYVFASLLVSLFARRKELAVLLAVGWRPRQLSRMIFLEATLLGCFVAVVACTILGLVLSFHHTETSLLRIALSGLLGFVIYELGAVIPAILSTRIAPMEAMRTGEMTKTSRRFMRTRSLFSMAFNHLIGTWRRTLLSIVAISVPTGLLAFFLFVTFRLKGVMYTTWLGQFVALQVGPQQYIAMIAALLIAVLTTAEVMWQNVSERQPEIALLKSVGWGDRSVRMLVLLEGGFSGLGAGIIGLAIAFGIIGFMYREIPYQHIWFLLATGVIPILTGFVGALLPSEKAVRVQPSQGVRGQYSSLKRTERRFRVGLGVAAVVLIAGFLTMIFMAVPQAANNQQEARSQQNQNVHLTSGKVTSSVHHVQKKKHSQKKQESNKKESTVSAQKLPIPVDHTIKLGETFDNGADMLSTKRVHLSNLRKPDPGMKYVSLQLAYHVAGSKNGPREQYQPYYFPLYTDKEKFNVVHFKIIKSKDYEHENYLQGGGSVTSVSTYQVPKDAKHLTVVALFNLAGHGNIAIKIK